MKSLFKLSMVLAITLILVACGSEEATTTDAVGNLPDSPVDHNSAPVISGIPTTSVDAGSSYLFTPTAHDADGDTLRFSIANLPSWASFNSNSGAISGTPSSADVGFYNSISISVSDGNATASLAAFNINVVSVATTQPGGQIGFSATTQSVSEGAIVNVTVMRTNAVGEASVVYGTHGLTAVPSSRNGDDYLGIDSLTMTFADGETSKVLSVQTLDNDIQENAETFEIYLTSPSSGYMLNTNDVHIVTITDNDVAQNQPPTISGNPEVSVTAGMTYSFTPSASDPDGDDLTFTASNLPAWLSINSGTGALTGTPSATDVGVYSNILITVSDGSEQASLASFSVTVNAADALTGTMALHWTAPTTRSDGSSLSLSEIGGYRIYLGSSSDNLEMQVDINDGTMTGYDLDNLVVGSYYVAVTTYDVDGAVSSFSNIVVKSVTN